MARGLCGSATNSLVPAEASTCSAASCAQENEKPGRLEAELELVDEKRAIVFVNTKNKCDQVSRQLDTLGHRCTVLHGSKTQARLLFLPCACASWPVCLVWHLCSMHMHAD